MEMAVVLARLGQFLGAAGLFGGALFLARQPSLGVEARGRLLPLGAAVLLAICTVVALITQAASMTGQTDPFAAPSMIGMVMTDTTFGYAVAVRFVATSAAILALALGQTRRSFGFAAALGAVGTITLAWGGHGVADEGLVGVLHLLADILHLLAAAVWIGALGALALMATARGVGRGVQNIGRLHAALDGFSGIGTLSVGLLIATGLVNSWLLIGPDHLATAITSLYGRLLLAKLVLFAGMSGLAAANRWFLTPRLGAAQASGSEAGAAFLRLRTSVLLETSIAIAVLGLVAWLGVLAPPISS